MIALPVDVLADLAAGRIETCTLVEGYFSTGTVRITDFARAVSYGGNTYDALGHLLAVSEIRESAQIIVSECEITLSGVDQAYIALLLTETYLDRRLMVYKAFLDGAGAVRHAQARFAGRMDAPEIVEDPDAGTLTVKVRATNWWADFERRPGRHTNYEETQLYYPGDRFFEFTSEINKQILWGER